MTGFSAVEFVTVPERCVTIAHAHLARVGRKKHEGFALWVGRLEGTCFRVTNTVIPEQTGYYVRGGVCVTVDEAELHRLNVWLHQNELRLIAQLHSHPREAYHSETDDAFPIATTEGCLSLVLPDFAREPFDLRTCAVYRLCGGVWVTLNRSDVESLIRIDYDESVGSD